MVSTDTLRKDTNNLTYRYADLHTVMDALRDPSRISVVRRFVRGVLTPHDMATPDNLRQLKTRTLQQHASASRALQTIYAQINAVTLDLLKSQIVLVEENMIAKYAGAKPGLAYAQARRAELKDVHDRLALHQTAVLTNVGPVFNISARENPGKPNEQQLIVRSCANMIELADWSNAVVRHNLEILRFGIAFIYACRTHGLPDEAANMQSMIEHASIDAQNHLKAATRHAAAVRQCQGRMFIYPRLQSHKPLPLTA